jgi:hypothetical protein
VFTNELADFQGGVFIQEGTLDPISEWFAPAGRDLHLELPAVDPGARRPAARPRGHRYGGLAVANSR